jgi:hypothetical protein
MSLLKLVSQGKAASTDTFVGFQNDYIVRLSSSSGCQTRRCTQPGPSSTNHHDIHLAWVVHTRAIGVRRITNERFQWLSRDSGTGHQESN